ncbi:hypothetical protein [Anaeromyxobacter oryzae]|uniref:Lipoprotein n=1 Tax=Anaeromyxobacter oryzae TaxID=2918170 RepID=A0ABN6MX39_9BACT|nr:hypothetical protein [Anaeromyxobacter oryzae]BDG05513.1 hypothetical protein AMOR_45090 [Anaeromyxobacter oryzae]
MSPVNGVRWFVTAVLLASCGRAPDLHVHGVAVYVETTAPFAQRGDLETRLESTVQAALDYWQGSWTDVAGRTITLDGGTHVACEGNASAIGCYDGNIRVSTNDVGAGTFSCVEQTVLVHEIGHAVIGDPLHQDPRWMEMDALADALAGRTGYDAEGEVPCVIFVSVWRHPLGRP